MKHCTTCTCDPHPTPWRADSSPSGGDSSAVLDANGHYVCVVTHAGHEAVADRITAAVNAHEGETKPEPRGNLPWTADDGIPCVRDRFGAPLGDVDTSADGASIVKHANANLHAEPDDVRDRLRAILAEDDRAAKDGVAGKGETWTGITVKAKNALRQLSESEPGHG